MTLRTAPGGDELLDRVVPSAPVGGHVGTRTHQIGAIGRPMLPSPIDPAVVMREAGGSSCPEPPTEQPIGEQHP